MKLVICTQHRENYGSEDQPYWKMKGGDVYVVENLTMSQAQKDAESGCPTLRGLIEHKGPMFEEYIIDIAAVSDDKVVCEPWESPVKLSYVQGVWKALQITENDEYGSMRQDIARKVIEWPLGDIGLAKAVFELVDGRKLSNNEYVAQMQRGE